MQTDLRNQYDEKAQVNGGILYLKGNVVQVWWETDVLGRKFNNGAGGDPGMPNGCETWTYWDRNDAIWGFNELKERFNSLELSLRK